MYVHTYLERWVKFALIGKYKVKTPLEKYGEGKLGKSNLQHDT